MLRRCIHFIKLKQAFSLIEVIVSITLLSIVLVSAVSYTSFLMRNMTYNQNKLYATRYLDDLKEWVDAERLTDWVTFSSKAKGGAGASYCINNEITSFLSLTNINEITSSSPCPFTGISDTNSAPNIYKRELNLTGNSDRVTATLTVSFMQDSKTYIETVTTAYSPWQK
jgi:prepilin-type N-terminal cleavage/methylation domain-containing protein